MEIRNNIGSFTSVRFPDETRDEQERRRCIQCRADVRLDALGEHRHLNGQLVRWEVAGTVKDPRPVRG